MFSFAAGIRPTATLWRRAKTLFHQKQNRNLGVAVCWWKRVDSNHRRRSQQIYSLSPLATWVLFHIQLGESGAGGRIRTPDLLITNQLLYQLSYTSTKQLYYINIGLLICQHFFSFFSKLFYILLLHTYTIFADEVVRIHKAPSDEGAGFLHSKKTGGENFPLRLSLPPSKIKDFCHLPRQREALHYGKNAHSQSLFENISIFIVYLYNKIARFLFGIGQFS